MTCEFLSGLTQLPFPSTAIVLGSGGITTAGTLYFYLTARNRAGWTIASSPIVITYPANSSITITLPAAARGLGTDFLTYSLSANTTSDPIGSYQLAEWENYQADQYTRRTLSPIVLSTNEHLNPAGSIAIPADLPTGTALKNGMHRLIVGGIPNGATSSYYKYSQYSTATANAQFVLEPHPGEKWVRTSNPYTGQIINAYGTGGCAADVRSIDSNYVIPPPLYNPVQSNPVKGSSPIKLTWRNDSTIALKAGTNFGLDIRQGSENRTDAFNGKLILTLKGFTDGLGGLDRLDDGGVNAMPNVDVDRVWGYTDDAIGILTLDKDLPPGESVVYEIAPYFTAQQFQGQLAPNELISTYLYPYTQSGKNVASLWAITGDMVLAVAERMHVVPLLGAGVKVNSGSAIVKAYTFTQVPDRSIYGLTPNTANQKITIDGNGICANRTNPLGSEAIRAIVSTQSGRSKLGTLSSNTTIAASGKANLTLTYPGYAGDGLCAIRSDYPTIGGDLGELNPTFVRIYAYNGTSYYPALSSGNTDIGLVPDFTQSIAIDSLGAAISLPTNPADALFGLFTPPTISATPTTGGSIPAGSYQFFAAYYYDGSTASAIDHTDPSVIRESELTIADLFALNQGWGRPIYSLADLRSIARTDTFAWQQRPVTGGSIFYYDPDSLTTDDGVSTFKPDYLASIEPGRWIIRKSYSVTPAGTWVVTTTYNYLEIVEDSDGSSYLYRNPAPSAGNALTNTTYWQKLAGKGIQGIQGIPGTTGTTTVGTNPNIPALNATAIYTVASTSNLAIGQYYAFSGTTGTLLVTAIPSTTTVTLQNTDSVAATVIPAGTKLLATGEKGDIGLTGPVGIVGATTSGTNPVTPALNGTATYTVDSIAGLAIGQYYKFSGVAGTLTVTALPTSTTATLQNIDATVGAAIAAGTKLNLAGLTGAIGPSGSPHVARGTYSGSATYSKFDEVNSSGSSYWWNNATPGNTAPPSSDWQLIASIGNPGLPGTGDMNKSVYDIDNNGVVDDAAKLNNQAGTYYLDRTNHTGTQVAATISDFSEAVDDRANALIVAGTGITKVYDDTLNTLTLSSTGVVPWTTVSGNVTVAAAGGRFSIDASIADVVLKLPTAPDLNAEVTYQIVDTSANNLYVEPTPASTIGTQLANFRGKHNPAIDRSLIETLRYVSGRWLPYFGRLIYEAFVSSSGDPYEAQTVFFAIFEGANNSTSFNDLKGNVISIRSGTPVISTAQSLFGNGSLYLDGASSLSVPAAASLVSGTKDFEWEIALYPTAFTSGNNQGLIDQRTSASDSAPEALLVYNTTAVGTPGHFTGTSALGLARLKLNQWQILRVSRYQGVKYIYLDDVPVYIGADNAVYSLVGSLIIGDVIDTASPFSGMFTGYIQYIRKSIGSSRKQGYGTRSTTFARPPITDADPLDAFKVLDINCDTGSIVDAKGHVITPTGAVAVSTVQERAGSHSIALTGGHLDIAGGTDFNFGSAPFSVHLSERQNVVGLGGGSTYPDNQYFYDFFSGGGANSALSYTSNGGTAEWRVNNAVAKANGFPETQIANTWYDLGMAKVDTKYLLIRNNQIVAASNNAPSTANYPSIRVGGFTGATSSNMQGYMDSVSVYKGIANGSNLTHSYPLRFLARFTGSSPNDELGAVGTIVGTAHTYDTSNKRSLEASALFAGSGHLSYPSIAAYDLGSGGFEISWWSIVNSTQPVYAGIAQSGISAGAFDSQSWVIYCNDNVNSKKLEFYCPAVSPTVPLLRSTTIIADDTPHIWRIIKYIIGASAVTVLICDGKIENVYIGAYTIAPTTRGLVLAAETFAANRKFAGNLDDFAIYKA